MSELNISQDGHFLWDGRDWISVEHVRLGVLGHLSGVHLSHDDNFWWNHVSGHWQRVADAPASAQPPVGPPGAPNPVTTTTPELEQSPSAADMNWGFQMLDNALVSIVPDVKELVDKIVELHGNAELVTKVLEKGAEGVHAIEVLGIAESGVIFAGSTAATIIVPFAMWYEAIGANNAGQKAQLSWQVYRPWALGLIGGLYNTNVGGVDELFAGWKEQGANFVNGLDDQGKRALTGALIATYVFNQSLGEVHQQLTHEQWDQRLNWNHAYSGLEIMLSAKGI